MLIKGKDIVIIGIQPWDIAIGSNCKNIAMQFAIHNRVLYVNPPLDRTSAIKDRHSEKVQKRMNVRKGAAPSLVSIQPNLWNLYPKKIVESINGLPDGKLFDILNYVNTGRFAKDIQSAIKELNFNNIVLFNDSSMFLGLNITKWINPTFYIYYIRDNLVKNWYWKKHGVRIEPKLIKKADLVVTNSDLYAQYAAQFNPDSYMVGQGCDLSLFIESSHSFKDPDDISGIPKPIVGYVGHLSSKRLDINLLISLMKDNENFSLVLVGHEDEMFQKSELHNMPNVHFLGMKDMKTLPAYIKCFDVAINPQQLNEATKGNYPRKIDEYLAMGKPVVATATPAMDYFKGTTYLAKNYEEWPVLIEKALKEDSPVLQEERVMMAKSHSWENNVDNIYKYMHLVGNSKKISF